MSNRRNRPALLILLAMVIAAVLTITFSPTVRAAVETILTFNGVTVSVDGDTGKLVVSGNLDAVVEQTDNSVTIKGENGEEAGAGIAVAQAVESVNVSDLLAAHPDLTLPTVPAGYTLQPQAELAGSGMTVTWQDSSGHMIIYQRSPASIQPERPVSQDGDRGPSIASGGQPTPVVNSGTGFIGVGAYSGPMVTYNWEAGGYFHELIITDTALSEADLQAILP